MEPFITLRNMLHILPGAVWQVHGGCEGFWNSLVLKPHRLCFRAPCLSTVMPGDGVNLKREDDRGKG